MFIAAPATTPAMSGAQAHVLGSLGASGAALVITFFLVLGVRGKHKIKLDHHQAAIVGLVAGTLYAIAAQIWSAPASITTSLTSAMQGPAGGNIGGGALAMLIVLAIYGMKLKPRTAAFLGIAAATVFGTAGGLWTVLTNTLAAGLNHWLVA